MIKFYYKHRKSIRCLLVVILSILLFVFVIPWCINYLYTKPATVSIFAMRWTAADVLAFYGSLLSAAATIFVLALTINFTVKNQKEERKLSIKPYLETNHYNFTDFDELPDGKDVTYIELTHGVITLRSGLPEDIIKIKNIKSKKDFESNYSINHLDEICYKSNMKNYLENNYLLYYEITNRGAGNAINVVLSLNDRTLISSFCVTKNESKKMVLILTNKLLENMDKKEFALKLSLRYTDIASLAEYSQTEEIYFTKFDELTTYQISGELLSKPVEVKRGGKI